MRDNYPVATESPIAGMIGKGQLNPTLRENIDQKIQYHLEEAERLKQIKEKLPQLLDVNLRDLREAMNY